MIVVEPQVENVVAADSVVAIAPRSGAVLDVLREVRDPRFEHAVVGPATDTPPAPWRLVTSACGRERALPFGEVQLRIAEQRDERNPVTCRRVELEEPFTDDLSPLRVPAEDEQLARARRRPLRHVGRQLRDAGGDARSILAAEEAGPRRLRLEHVPPP